MSYATENVIHGPDIQIISLKQPTNPNLVTSNQVFWTKALQWAPKYYKFHFKIRWAKGSRWCTKSKIDNYLANAKPAVLHEHVKNSLLFAELQEATPGTATIWMNTCQDRNISASNPVDEKAMDPSKEV